MVKFDMSYSDDGVKFTGDRCWCCGSKQGLTSHHAINRHLDPLFNVQVPLCKKCHRKHNVRDFLGLKNFAYKINAGVKGLAGQTKALNSLLNDNDDLKKKKGDR